MTELGARVEELSEEIINHPHADDWAKRNEALLALDELFDSEAANNVTADDLKPLKFALENALNDLRSTLVKGACQVLETVARAGKDACARLIRELLSVLVEQSGSANKVIKSYTDPCILEVIRHVRFRQGIPAICTFAESHSQKGVRQQCTRCMHQLLSSWGSPYCDGQVDLLQHAIAKCLEDSCPLTRGNAREAYAAFADLYPGKTDAILASVDHRTRKTLTEQQHGDNGPPSPGTSTPSGQRQRAAPAASSKQQQQQQQQQQQENNSPSTPSSTASSAARNGGADSSSGGADADSSAPDSPQSHSRQGTVSGASSISTDHEDDEEPVFEVGQSVRLIRKPRERTAKPNPIAGRSGVVKFIGRTRFKSGLWIGVDMGEAVGKNDGSIQGERYFKCGVNCGIFVRQSQLEEVEEGEEEHGDHFDATRAEEASTSEPPQSREYDLLLRQKAHVGEMLQMLEQEMLLIAEYEKQHSSRNESFLAYHEKARYCKERQLASLQAFMGEWTTYTSHPPPDQQQQAREKEKLSEEALATSASSPGGVLLG
jgi:hypothetical protein